MTELVTVEELQQWLEPTKLEVTEVDDERSDTANAEVLGRISSRYDVTGWVDVASTPKLVRSIISMLIASWEYRSVYSEATAETQNSYADWLESRANLLIEGIVSGTIDLTEVDTPATSGPLFWPDQTTGMTQQYDAAGHNIGNSQFSEDRKFAMGMRF